jgi:hypothetical protein
VQRPHTHPAAAGSKASGRRIDAATGYTGIMATYRNTPAYASGGLGVRLALARLITAVAGIAAAIIVLAIVLHVLGAKTSNGVVSAIHDAGSWLSSWSHGLFSLHNGDVRMAVNWGIAAVVYLVVARFVARVIAR